MLSGRGSRAAIAACTLVAALLAGCQNEPSTGPRIVTISAVSGIGQVGLVGGLLDAPLVVRASDQTGAPVSGATITWSVVSGGGTITPPQSVTGPDGLTSASFRLGSALGVQSARATLGGAPPVTFQATATPAPASALAIVSGNNQSAVVLATLAQDLVVRVTDAFGNTVAGANVIFAATIGGGSVSTPNVPSDATGTARVRWTLGTVAGTQQVTAIIAGVTPVNFTATALPGPAAGLAVVSGSGQSAIPGSRLPDSLVVRVVDQFDNPVRDASVSWAPVGASAGTVSPNSGKTDALGRTATAWTIGPTGGPKEVRASVSGLPTVSFTAAGTIVFVSAAAGGRHTCGLDEVGVAYCWGRNVDGQLGIGPVPQGAGPFFATPQAVAGGLTFSGASGGSFHTCALAVSQQPYCWGLNPDGRVGNGQNATALQPVLVSGVNTYSAIEAGATHSCAITVGSRLFCWGSNVEGQVGVGSVTASFNTPQAVQPAQTWLSVAAGGLHTCAVTTAQGVLCFGGNVHGQLGTGGAVGSNVPVAVATGGMLFNSVVAGDAHTCALRTTGAAFCWGRNNAGQVGDGTTNSRATPVPVAGGLLFESLAAGHSHTCGRTAAGIVYCWGLNSSGQLGNGTTVASLTPVAVGGGLTISVLTAGESHTCGVTTGRVVYCWGDNQLGQLGDGTQSNRSVPTKVEYQP